jgi:L-fuconolactonase
MTIDSHQHFWKYDSLKHDWINDEMSIIRRDFLPDELEKIYAKNEIDGCIAVQADQTLEENDFLLDLSKNYDFIKGIVGWINLRSDKVEEVLERYQGFKKLKGFRHIVQGESDPNFLLRPKFLNGISKLEKFNYTYDILVFPHQLGAVMEFVRSFPTQKFVIDHIAKPYIKDGFFDGWATMMREIGKESNVYCKLSGMITEANFKEWTAEQIEIYMELVLESFGSNRLMYGSERRIQL